MPLPDIEQRQMGPYSSGKAPQDCPLAMPLLPIGASRTESSRGKRQSQSWERRRRSTQGTASCVQMTVSAGPRVRRSHQRVMRHEAVGNMGGRGGGCHPVCSAFGCSEQLWVTCHLVCCSKRCLRRATEELFSLPFVLHFCFGPDGTGGAHASGSHGGADLTLGGGVVGAPWTMMAMMSDFEITSMT